MKKTLKDILAILDEKQLIIASNIRNEALEIESVTDNSKEVVKNSLFFCKGAHFKKAYLDEAINNGIACYVTENKDLTEQSADYILVNNIRKAMALIGCYYYDNAWKEFKLIGITGTKGKSTTAYFIKSIIDNYMNSLGEKPAGILSSIENYDGSIFEESHLTTPEPLKLHWHFNNMKQNGLKYCIMEVSSQALKYDRVSGVEFDIGCFLNIGEDHISDVEHSSFEDYFMSKNKLFDIAKNMIVWDKLEFPKDIISNTKANIIKFGENKESKYLINNIVKKEDCVEFEIICAGEAKPFKIMMAGLFNVFNAATAIAVATELDIPYNNIYDGLVSAQVSGRMELFLNREKNITAIVDYAHNKLSFETLFESTKTEYPNKKIITVFGCPGGKAFARRKDLGELAAKNSDLVIITEEDHGEEALGNICKEIESFALPINSNCKIILDREEAIKTALKHYDSDAVVLITGKGRETRQKRGTEYIETISDVEIVEKYINTLEV